MLEVSNIPNNNSVSGNNIGEKVPQLSLLVESDINKESEKKLRPHYDQFIAYKYVTVRHQGRLPDEPSDMTNY